MSTPSDDYLDTAVQQALGSLSREDIESMMISGYAEEMGVDEDAVRDYIEQMDDDMEEFVPVEDDALLEKLIAIVQRRFDGEEIGDDPDEEI